MHNKLRPTVLDRLNYLIYFYLVIIQNNIVQAKSIVKFIKNNKRSKLYRVKYENSMELIAY